MTLATVSADGETITVHIPMTFRKRGGRKLVVMPDNAMVKALARAFRWRKMLDTDVHASLEDPTRAPRVRPHIVQLRRARDLALTDGSASFGYSLSCLLMIFRVGLRRFLVHVGLGLILERREDWEMVRSDISEPLQTDWRERAQL